MVESKHRERTYTLAEIEARLKGNGFSEEDMESRYIQLLDLSSRL